MGIHVIKMPDIGEGIAEVELVAWNVKEGDTVVEDQHLADVMTDKATVEIPSPVEGEITWTGGEIGETLAIGSALVRIKVAGEAGAAEEDAAPTPPRPASAGTAGTAGRPRASRASSAAGTSARPPPPA